MSGLASSRNCSNSDKVFLSADDVHVACSLHGHERPKLLLLQDVQDPQVSSSMFHENARPFVALQTALHLFY